MDPQLLSTFLEHMKQQTEHMKEQRRYMKEQTSMNEEHMSLLRSIKKHLEKSSAFNLLNKFEDEDHMKKEWGQKVMKKEEQLDESPAPWPSRSRTEGKKYRLHIVGKVCQPDENKNVIIKGKPIPNIEVILMHGGKPVPASDHLAAVRVELVVLNANFYIDGSDDWPPEWFKDHFFMMASKTSATRMTVEKAIFSLHGGRKVHSVASIKESSGKQKVRLGVMVVDDGSVQERVLEGVSSNEFSVIHKPRPGATCAEKESKRKTTGNSELNTNGKRVINNRYDATLQPSTSSYLQFSGHVQSAQKFAQHAIGEQISHARNACLTQNRSTTRIDAGDFGQAVPPAYAANSYQGFPALVHRKLDENHGIPSEEAYDGFMPNSPGNQDRVDLSSQNPMMVEEHVQSPQKCGHHATGAQPSHARNACWPQKCLATTIGNIEGVVPPQAYAPIPYAASVQTGYWQPDDNQGHVDPSSMMEINPVHKNPQGLQTQLGQFGDMVQENGADDKGRAPMSESPGDDEVIPLPRESSDSTLCATINELGLDVPSSFPEGSSSVPSWVDELRLQEWTQE